MIHIKDNWYIEVDDYSYNLQQYNGMYTDKNGNEVKQWKNQTYHATLERALQQYLTYRVRDALTGELELNDALKIMHDELQKVREEIAEITGGM